MYLDLSFSMFTCSIQKSGENICFAWDTLLIVSSLSMFICDLVTFSHAFPSTLNSKYTCQSLSLLHHRSNPICPVLMLKTQQTATTRQIQGSGWICWRWNEDHLNLGSEGFQGCWYSYPTSGWKFWVTGCQSSYLLIHTIGTFATIMLHFKSLCF